MALRSNILTDIFDTDNTVLSPARPGKCNDYSVWKYIAGETPALEAPDTSQR